MPYIDLSGKRFGHWTVIRYTITKPGGAYWLCQCDCGKISEVHGGNLKSGKSTNCGCLRKKHITHGLSKTRIYNIYIQIKERCYNKNNPAYPRYGGRGIEMCDDWKESFESFRNWSMSNGYSEELTIDRIDNNGNYCPDNCRWVSYEIQANNTRKNIYVSINGDVKTLSQWCRKTGVLYTTAYQRLRRGIKPEYAIKPII